MNTAIASKFLRFIRTNVSKYQKVTLFSTKPNHPSIPVNPLKEVFSATQQDETGVIYDKKPFKIRCEAGKIYHWCTCGQSKTQPFCDGTHKNIFLKIKLRPVRFTVTETKDYWLCNCKQTLNRPFCDGTHKRQDIQELKR
ncbi:hypothetical protein V1478_000561 [Vespula squamosa]|uniref:Iron-binding zinc finger CDGSH type domain-containing protein n=1 Tax=Vespula squamosa TaxID=30214 RepID=A0ABD2C5Y3_VESSQ